MTLIRLTILQVLFLFFTSLSFAETKKELNLAAVLSFTGMASSHGTAIRDGLEFARTELEDQGWKVTIEYQDDASLPKNTVSSVRQLTNQGHKFFIGPTWGIFAIPTATIFDKTNALSIQPCNSSDFVTEVSDNFFFLFSPPSTAQITINEFTSKFKGKKVAILNNTSPWGELWKTMFEEAIKKAGAILVRTDMVQFSDIDHVLPSLMTRYKNEGINLILSTTTKESTAQTIKVLERLKHPAVLLSPDLVDAVSEKLVGTKSNYVTASTITPIESKEFRKEFQEKHKRPPLKYTDSGYDALITLAETVEKVGHDPIKVKDYFLTKLDREGATGRIKFNESHDILGRGYEITKLVSISD